MFKRCQETFACFIHTPDPRGTFEVTPEEREAFLEKLYATPGFGMWQGNFRDMLTNREANAIVSDFVARKIRQRVKDPKVAEKLIPKDHGFGTRRVPMETSYYEVYNQPNVQLVDIKETPIERITPKGIKTSDAEYEFDIIIYATGFDAITGSFDRIDIRGLDGLRLKDKWAKGPQTFLGVQVEGFPNMFMLVGPHTALGNIPRSIEYNVDWVTGLIRHMRDRNLTRADATAGGRGGLDRLRQGEGRRPAVQRGQLLDDRHQPQRGGQADPHPRALQRQRPGLPRAVRRGGGEGISRNSRWHRRLRAHPATLACWRELAPAYPPLPRPGSSSCSARQPAPSRSSNWPLLSDHRKAARPMRPRNSAQGMSQASAVIG